MYGNAVREGTESEKEQNNSQHGEVLRYASGQTHTYSS